MTQAFAQGVELRRSTVARAKWRKLWQACPAGRPAESDGQELRSSQGAILAVVELYAAGFWAVNIHGVEIRRPFVSDGPPDWCRDMAFPTMKEAKAFAISALLSLEKAERAG